LSRIGLVNEVKMLKARNISAANRHLLTTQQITAQAS
jgi:hypothetical protein